jgi:hypothetical protein
MNRGWTNSSARLATRHARRSLEIVFEASRGQRALRVSVVAEEDLRRLAHKQGRHRPSPWLKA